MIDDIFLNLGDAVVHLLHACLEFLKHVLVLGNLDLMLVDTQLGGLSHDLHNFCLFTEVVGHLRGALDEGLMHVLEQGLVGLNLLNHAFQSQELRHAH